jgi:hypothetical protein
VQQGPTTAVSQEHKSGLFSPTLVAKRDISTASKLATGAVKVLAEGGTSAEDAAIGFCFLAISARVSLWITLLFTVSVSSSVSVVKENFDH